MSFLAMGGTLYCKLCGSFVLNDGATCISISVVLVVLDHHRSSFIVINVFLDICI